MKISEASAQEALNTYRTFWEANLAANMPLFSSYLVNDFSIFGTANGEIFFNKKDAVDFYTRTADQLRGNIDLRNRDIRIQGIDHNTALVLEQCDVYVRADNEWIYYGQARITCVMDYSENTWKAVHQHVSFPDHRTESGQQIATEQIQKENLLLKEAVKRRTIELESKNRELEIETAVEKVRAQSMAMHHTDDLAKVTEELYNQITNLRIDGFTGVAIYLVDEEDMVTVWDLSSPGSMSDATSFAFRYNPYTSPVLGEFVPILKEGKVDYFIMDYPAERLRQVASELQLIYPAMAESFHAALDSGHLQHQWNATGIIYNGVLSIDLMRAPGEEEKMITIKMAGAFNLAYQRFLDLKKAEAQTKRAELDLLEIKAARKKAEETLAELQTTQKQLIQSEKMASLGELTAGIAHEIQNPLNFVNNFSEVSTELIDEMNSELEKGDLIEAMSIADDLRQNLEKINHHGKRADAIVKGMLHHSRNTNNATKEPYDINSLADEYLRLAYHGLRAKDKSFNASIQTSFAEQLPLIPIIPQEIGRVILNLVTNAFYAVNEKKKKLGNVYDPKISMRTQLSNDYIELSVTDNGDGIPEKIRDKIFQPFFTTKPTGQGTGLGLSMSYDIVTKAHNGNFSVSSQEGVGTTFTILLPVGATLV